MRAPSVLIVDEPTLGLAPTIAVEVLRVIAELAEHGVTVLVVEEKPTGVLPLADHVALLSGGRVVWEGAAGDLDATLLEDVYFGRVSVGAVAAPGTPQLK